MLDVQPLEGGWLLGLVCVLALPGPGDGGGVVGLCDAILAADGSSYLSVVVAPS